MPHQATVRNRQARTLIVSGSEKCVTVAHDEPNKTSKVLGFDCVCALLVLEVLELLFLISSREGVDSSQP